MTFKSFYSQYDEDSNKAFNITAHNLYQHGTNLSIQDRKCLEQNESFFGLHKKILATKVKDNIFQHPKNSFNYVSLKKINKIFNKFTLNASLNLADIMLYRKGFMQVDTKNKTPDTVFTLNETFSLSALCSR